jgi:hypothetical protein
VHQRVDQIGRQRHNDNQQDDRKNIGHTPVYPANGGLKSQAVGWQGNISNCQQIYATRRPKPNVTKKEIAIFLSLFPQIFFIFC